MSGHSPIRPHEDGRLELVAKLAAPNRAKRLVVGALGVLALALAVVVVTGIGGAWVQALVDGSDGPARVLVYFGAHLGVAVAGWTVWRNRSTSTDSAPLTLPQAPESTDDADAVVGGELESTLDALASLVAFAYAVER